MATRPAKKAVIKKPAAKKTVTKRPAAKKSSVQTDVNKPDDVNAFMAELDHPYKAEVQAVREIIKGVDKNITEQVKWKAPSFSYKGYLVTFNLWARQHVHLVFHDGAILHDTSGFLQGDYPDRRMAYFANMAEVKAKQPVLEKLIRQWISIKNKETQK